MKLEDIPLILGLSEVDGSYEDLTLVVVLF